MPFRFVVSIMNYHLNISGKEKYNDSGFRRCQNQMWPRPFYLHVDTDISDHQYDRIVCGHLPATLV
jgi:hypothetical protein